MPYAFSYANEVVTKAVCIFKMVNGNTKDAMIAAVNIGRDTDCIAAVAAGISGALTGAESLPKEYITQTDHATGLNIYTNTQRTLHENSEGLYQAWLNRINKFKAYISLMEV
jgi:ADP-ribosylglycohydrolase